MAPRWQPGEQYQYGDVVEFEEVEYQIIQPHRSQGDWTPPLTPALWGRLQGEHHRNHHHREEKRGGDFAPPDYGQQRYHGHRKETDELSYQASGVQPPQKQQEKSWYEDHEKELKTGGGILAGVAAVGAGYYAYQRHEQKSEEEQKHHAHRQKTDELSYQASAQLPQEQQEKHWYEEHGKELKTGGGILAGVAAAGAGYYAYQRHEQKSEEEQKHHAHRQKTDELSYQARPAAKPPQEQQEKPWYEEHKKELEIGGGILAGVAAVGAGYYAYQRHEQKSEEEQTHAWSASNWVQDSQNRTKQWRAGQYNAPVAWVWNEGKSIPRDAIQGGEERGESLYICRAYHEGGILVGKASSVFKKGAVIGFKKDEIHLDKYEILVGDSRAVRWVPCSGQLNLEALRARPVEGGREPEGAPIYIAQAPHHGAVHPGKACEIYGDGCFIPYDDSEKKVKEYAVLCYA